MEISLSLSLEKKRIRKMPTLERIDTGNDAAIAAAIAAFEAESAQHKPEKTDEKAGGEAAIGDGSKAKGEEVAAALATNEEPKPSTTAATAATAAAAASASTSISAKRTFSADDCSSDEALAWALHEADQPSNKGPSAFARAAAVAASSSSPSASPPRSSSPPSPASAAALAASAPLADWRALLERAASERVAGERFAPLVPRPLLSAAAPWPWSGIGSGFGGAGGGENRERARLAATLARLGLVERPVGGDGACQFRALSDQLYGSEDYHEAVRGLAVQTLAAHPERYAAFICGGNGNGSGCGNGDRANGDPNLFTSYVARMSNPKEWGDHVTLQAAADGLGLRIVVVSSFEREPLIEIEPAEKRSDRVLFVAFWHEIHYGSVYVAPPPSSRVVPAFPVMMPETNGGGSVAEGVFGQPGPASAGAGTARPLSPPEKVRRWFRERLA